MDSAIPHIIHGSEDSLDIDVYFLMESLSDFNSNKKLCDEMSHQLGVNGNLIVIRDGTVREVYKGTVDEVNNSILATYHLHEQKFPIPVTQKVKRDFSLKWIRVIRGILSHCSRTKYRTMVKEAIRSGSLEKKMDALLKLDFTAIEDFNKEPAGEVHKFICFQVAQMLALMEGVEVYTKSQAAEYMKNEEVTKMLYRQEADVSILNSLMKIVFFPMVMDKRKDSLRVFTDDFSQIITPFGVLDVKSEKYL